MGGAVIRRLILWKKRNYYKTDIFHRMPLGSWEMRCRIIQNLSDLPISRVIA